MNKKNLPNIPIYIGDWERDCNILSLESEMAWMKIIFKMHLLGKNHTYKASTKALQILWKSSQEKVTEILDELKFNEICEISEITGGYEFLSRRLKRENDLSEVRAEAVSNRYKKDKIVKSKTTKPLQTPHKKLQNTDIDYDYDIDNENKNEVNNEKKNAIEKFKIEKNIIYPFDNENFKAQWSLWKIYKSKEFKFNYKSAHSEQASLMELANISSNDEKKAIAVMHQSMSNGWKGFFELKNASNGNIKTNEQIFESAMDSEVARNFKFK